MSMSLRPQHPLRVAVRAILLGALAAALACTGVTTPGRALTATAADSSPQAARTWIVDAVDDASGNRWESRDTGTSEVTVQVGDTVEWRFEWPTAGQEHDLTSQDTPQGTWMPAVQEYRAPGDEPVRHTFTEPGTYHYVCSIHGTMMRGTVVVEDGGPGQLPGVSATAAPSSGTAPLTVSYSAEVTTSGAVEAFSAGLATYPDLAGTATMVRRRGETYAALDVSGLKPSAMHMVHVHEEPCATNNGGAHFRLDETQPFAEDNELWLPFTSDTEGRSGPVSATQPQRAGADAVSIVVHDPDNPAQRIGCADLAPSTADLGYSWDFGDGTTGQGAEPEHTYANAGTYTATLTVTNSHGASVTDTVVVTAAATPVSPAPPPPAPAPIDVHAPQTGLTGGPDGAVRARRATFGLTSSEPGSSFFCSLDGAAWHACSARATFRDLRQGRHRLHVRATDAVGNTDPTPASHSWTVDRTGPKIRKIRPAGSTSDRTPKVRARVTDRLSRVRRRSLTLRIDGRRVGRVRFRAARDQVSWMPRRAMTPGRHRVRLVAVDAVGNRTVRKWRFRVAGGDAGRDAGHNHRSVQHDHHQQSDHPETEQATP